MATLREKLRKDETFKSYLNIVRMIGSRINVDNVHREVRLLNTGRLTKDLDDKTPSAPKLYEAVAKDMAVRSRLTAIRCSLFPESSLLKVALRKAESHVRVAYVEDLKKYGSTVEARNQVLRRILHDGYQLHDSIEASISVVDMVIKDVDQASYSTSSLTRLLGFMLDRKEPS